MPVLTFSSEKEHTTDLHVVYEEYGWHEMEYSAILSTGLPVIINRLTLRGTNPYVSPISVGFGLGLYSIPDESYIKEYWRNHPKRLYDESNPKSLQLPGTVEGRILYKRTYLPCYMWKYGASGITLGKWVTYTWYPRVPTIFLVLWGIVGHGAVGYRNVCLEGEMDFVPCADIKADVPLPKEFHVWLGKEFSIPIKISNLGDCLGMYSLNIPSPFNVFRENWISPKTELSWTQPVKVEEPTVLPFTLTGSHFRQYSRPEAEKVLPSFYWHPILTGQSQVIPVRFLDLGDKATLLKGDVTEEIGYEGYVIGADLKVEGLETPIPKPEMKLTLAAPFPMPAIILKGTLKPLKEGTITYTTLYALYLKFSKPLTVREQGAIKDTEATEYSYQRPLGILPTISFTRRPLPASD